MFPVHPRTFDLVRGLSAIQKLEKLAGLYPDDVEVQEKTAAVRAQLTNEIFEFAKEATLGRALKWGLGVGTGVAAPITLGGAALARYGRSQSEQTAENVGEAIRNKLLTGALSLAGIGLGTYGVSKLLGGAAGNPIDRMIAAQGPQAGAGGQGLTPQMFPKWGSADEQARVEEAVEKLAAVGVVENLLDTLPATLSEAAQKTAAEVRSLNRQYGTYVLSELCR